MGTTNHKALGLGNIHVSVNWASTGSPTGLSSDDDNKFWLDTTNDTLWVCTDGSIDEFTMISLIPSAAGASPDFTAPADFTVTTDLSVGNDASITNDLIVGNDVSISGEISGHTRPLVIQVEDLSTALVAATDKAGFTIPTTHNGLTLTAVHARVKTAATGTTTIDINKNGTSLLSTKLTIDSGETGSDTAATTAVIVSDGSEDVASYDLITIDIDGVGSVAAEGLIVQLYFK